MKEQAQTEEQMRKAKTPWPKTQAELTEYITSLVERDHDYGTCIYAMSMAAEATFNYVASKLGVTGFQTSCADLNFIHRTRGLKGPMLLLNGEDLLYPQYNIPSKVLRWILKQRQWCKEQAREKLKSTPLAHPEVLAHWQRLAEYNE